MKRRLTSALVMLLAFALLIGTTAITASAATTYTVNGTKTEFNKYLVVDKDTNIPAISFNFTVAPGTPAAATSTTPAILAGVGTPTIATVTFTNGQETSTTQPESGLTLASGKKFAVQTATVDFSGVTFTEPGVYRYVITEQETAGAKAVTYDTQATTPGSKVRYLDVYVADVNNALTVSSYVMHETTTVVANNDADGKADDKSSSYVNEISTKDLERPRISNSVKRSPVTRVPRISTSNSSLPSATLRRIRPTLSILPLPKLLLRRLTQQPTAP